LRERVAREAGRVRGRADPLFNPSSIGYADTFSRKGRRKRDMQRNG